MKTDKDQLVPWLLWRIWKNRNDLVLHGKEYGAMELVEKAKEDMDEWRNRVEVKSMRADTHPHVCPRTQWKPPPNGWLKCNVDGAWDQTRNRCGIGWVLRNEQGKVLWMGTRRLPMLRSPLDVELEGLRWAVLRTSILSYDNIIFETDSQTAHQVILNAKDWPAYATFNQDVHHLLSSLLQYKVVFQSREANCVADRIAKEANSFLNYDPKLYSGMPIWINSFVEEDNRAL